MGEPETSEALVPAGNGALDVAEAERRIAELRKAGDTERLGEVGRQAAAYQQYERLNGFKQKADEFGRLRIRCEAALGRIDLAENPFDWHPGRSMAPMLIDGKPVGMEVRTRWRLLGVAEERQVLEREMDALSRDPTLEVAAGALVPRLRALGVAWVPAEYLRARYGGGESWTTIAVRLGIDSRAVGRVLGRRKDAPKAVNYHLACEFARVLGLAIEDLPMMPRRWRRGPMRDRRRLGRKIRPGRWDKAYGLIRKALAEVDAVEGTRDDRVWELLYEAGDIVRRRA